MNELPIEGAVGVPLAGTGAPRDADGLRRPTTAALVAAAVVFAAIAVGGVFYAKWWPYGHKLATLVQTHVYPGKSILNDAGAPGAAPSWHDAWHFTVVYGEDIWIALVAAILIGAGLETLIPRSALRRAAGRRPFRASLAGGLAALPCMMCTCCGAPITRALRRSGVPVAGALSYWLGNPLLNPAVLAFLAIALPWPYVASRILVGLVLVFAAAPLVARLAPGTGEEQVVAPAPARRLGALTPRDEDAIPVRYLRALVRLALFLLPEYFVVVLLVGAFRGWLLPLGHGATSWGVGAAVLAAAAGALLVIPTAAEIPIILGLLATGFSPLVCGAVLIALPAISLPSMSMVGRALSWRVTAATLGLVVCGALLSAGLVSAFS